MPIIYRLTVEILYSEADFSVIDYRKEETSGLALSGL